MDGGMPWFLPGDLRYFKETTSNSIVIMGRKTFESIGKPLPNRKNIIVSRKLHKGDLGEGVIIADSLQSALVEASTVLRNTENGYKDEVFIMGGGEIYNQAITLPTVTKLYITMVDAVVDGDTFFPTITSEWAMDMDSIVKPDKLERDSHDYLFLTYNRKEHK
jgi:dihydrofolate reductase